LAAGEATLAVVDDVAGELAVAAQATHLQHARVRDLDRLLAELEHVAPRAALVAMRAELVHAAERRLIEARHELRADAPGVDLRALLDDVRDQRLVEIIRRDDLRVAKARVVEHAA